MSKRGRKVLRSILFFPAMVAVQHDEHMKAQYEKHRAKGAGSMTAETHHTAVLQPVNMKGKNDTTFT